MRNVLKIALLAAATLVIGSTGIARANLILNSGFETGDFTDWSVIANATLVAPAGFSGYLPHSGASFAALGNVTHVVAPYHSLSATLLAARSV